MEIFIIAVLIGLIPASIASRKGRSFGLWWLFGALLFIIALPASLLIRGKDREEKPMGNSKPGSNRALVWIIFLAVAGVVIFMLMEIEREQLGISATPQQQPVVTMHEYQRIQNGMSYRQVVSIIGQEGEEISRNFIEGAPGVMEDIETVMYQWQNTGGSNMNAMFQNDKLMQKAQFGLR